MKNRQNGAALVQAVFEHGVHQRDLRRILDELSQQDRESLLAGMGELLRRVWVLTEVSTKVSDTLSLDALLPHLMEIVAEALGAERSTLFLFDPETEQLHSRVVVGGDVNTIQIPSNAGIAGAVFSTERSEIVNDAYADPRFNASVDRRTGFHTRNILAAPIIRKGQAIGVAQVLNKCNDDFTQDDLKLLEVLMRQAASVLENAQLYERVARARREEAKLLEVTNAIASELQLDPLLRKIIGAATEMLDAERSTLFMFDPESDELWSRIAEGLEVKEIRIPSTSGIAGACFTSGKVINIPDAYQDPRFNPDLDRKTGFRTHNLLTIPVFTKNREKIAVIQVLNKRGGAFDAFDEKRLMAFSAQAAIALENARLFEDVLNARNYNESILKSMSNGVITLDRRQCVAKVNDAVLRLLKWDPEKVTGRALRELFGERNKWIFDGLQKVISSGTTEVSMDTEICLEDGALISANTSIVPLIDIYDQPIGYMIVIEDITKEKRVKTTMARYMTKDLVDRLLEQGDDALGGQSQVATVLFSDIRDFTSISENLGPKETVSMLNEYFTDMIDVIFSRHGVLDKYIGDAIMALFGTPFPADLDADNAVLVANEMVRELDRFNQERRRRGQATISIGIGISTGEVIAGNIGSPKRMDYTVIGDTVNLAARLESATKYYGVKILLSEFTARALRHDHAIRQIDRIRVKGKKHPVSVYESLEHYDDGPASRSDAFSAFGHGLARYFDRDWKSAETSFAEALAQYPDDVPSRVYLERCRLYQKAPPEHDWDGVWTMQGK